MIINVGGRTDIVNYYSEWLLNRLEEGYAFSRNPLFPNKITKYQLNPDVVDCIIFCSKNYKPILPHIGEIAERFNIYCHYTITAYGKDIEPNVPDIDESINTLIELSHIVGKEKIAWRYDPVLLTADYTIERHIKTFEHMVGKLSSHVGLCIFSFVEMYKRLEVNMPELIPITDDNKEVIAKVLGSIAKKCNLKIQTCESNGDYQQFGIFKSGCMTTAILEQAGGGKFKKVSHNGMREGCHCMPSRDIGAYNTCLNGCRYCYANKKPELAAENFKLHDKKSPLLLGQIKPTDIIQNGSQRSFLVK